MAKGTGITRREAERLRREIRQHGRGEILAGKLDHCPQRGAVFATSIGKRGAYYMVTLEGGAWYLARILEPGPEPSTDRRPYCDGGL